MKLFTLSLILLVTYVTSFSQNKSSGVEKVGETVPVTDTNINWEQYDSASTVLQSNIALADIQGMWKARKGVYRFNNIFNQMNLTTPFIVQIKDNGIRRNKKDPFEKFTIQGKYIIIPQRNSIDTGIINKLTPKDLTITWKDGSNYTRYFYEK